MYKKTFLPLLLFLVLGLVSVEAENSKISPQRGQEEMFGLLKSWCDALLEHQLCHKDKALDGGVVCPGCALMHGRAPDAIYPFLYMADQTKDLRYVEAAKKLFVWGKENVRFSDGTWNNEVSIYTWRGTTVFILIALLESLNDFGYLIDDATKSLWMETISEQLTFVASEMKPGFGNINYPASACYALALAGKVMNDKKYTEQAAVLIREIMPFFTENETFFFGEGQYRVKSAKGLLPVDLGYNVEETLPNLMLYADLSGNTSLKEKIKQSMDSHIEFMLPDGAWDNSWGTRNYKWTYWGSRTCDGVISLCNLLSSMDPVYAEIGYRNFELLKECTADGLLYGGMHYKLAGYSACIHHTFEHAKGLAIALNHSFVKPVKRIPLPREKEYGVKHFKDLDIWTIAKGDWRGTVTGYDVAYTKSGGNAHGGALSLLWNKKTGPLLAAAMTEYSMFEPSNMQVSRSVYNYPSALCVEYHENGKKYTNICSKKSTITHYNMPDGEKIVVNTELVTKDLKAPDSGKIPVEITYFFTKETVTIQATSLSPLKNRGLTLFIPLISASNEKYYPHKNGFCVENKACKLHLLPESPSEIKTMPAEANKRAFNLAPGFEFIPFSIAFSEKASVKIVMDND